MGEKIGRGIEPNIVVHMKVAFDVPADYQCTTILALDFPPRFVKEMFKFSVIQITHVHLSSFVASISHIPTHEGASSLKLCSIPFLEIDLVANCISRFFHHTRYEPVTWKLFI